MAKKKKTRKRAVSRKKPARRKRARRSNLSAATTSDIVKELERRERLLGKLEGKRDQLLDALASIEKEIAASSRTVSRRGRPPAGASAKRGRPRATGTRKATRVRKRPKNATNLVEALAKVLKGKTMGVAEVTMAVQKAGYKTTSPNFRTIVNQTLINSKSRFKKIERGKYSAK